MRFTFKRKKPDTVQSLLPGSEVAVEEQKESIEELFERTESYVNTNINLLRLKAVDKSAHIVSSFSANLVFYTLCFLVVMMVSVGAAIWIGQEAGKIHLGFMIIGGFYALVAVIYFLFGKKWIKRTVRQSVISDLIK